MMSHMFLSVISDSDEYQKRMPEDYIGTVTCEKYIYKKKGITIVERHLNMLNVKYIASIVHKIDILIKF